MHCGETTQEVSGEVGLGRGERDIKSIVKLEEVKQEIN